MNLAPQGRDERSVVVGHKSPVNNITERFRPAEGGARAVERMAPEHRGSALRTEREERMARERDEIAPAVLRRVLKDAPAVTFALPDGGSYRGRLKAGKVLSSLNYDLADLKAQGVHLGDVTDEILGVPAQGGVSAQVQLKDMLAVLREMGMEIVPRAAPAEAPGPAVNDEVARLRAELAEMKAKLEAKPTEPESAEAKGKGDEPKERARR